MCVCVFERARSFVTLDMHHFVCACVSVFSLCVVLIVHACAPICVRACVYGVQSKTFWIKYGLKKDHVNEAIHTEFVLHPDSPRTCTQNQNGYTDGRITPLHSRRCVRV